SALKGMSGSASPHINVGDIKAFKMILPPIDKQEQFTAFITQVDKSKLLIFVIIAFIQSRNLQYRFYLR
ncbi:MAG: restriction endonuclease subunit S, partial [Lachnospiraceae bacterium]|nr:restriction endonuclease subunit S [Lachnospiraceae bacterium]